MIAMQIVSGALLVAAFLSVSFWATLAAVDDHMNGQYGWAALNSAVAATAVAVVLAVVIGAIRTAGAY